MKVTSVISGPKVDSSHVIAAIAKLWIAPQAKVLDVTFGDGVFWKQFRPQHFRAHDIAIDGVDFRQLPWPDHTWNVVVLDPPLVAKGGRTTSTIDDFDESYGLADAPRTPEDLDQLYADAIKEASRVLTGKGILVVKCMDYVSGGKFHMGHKAVVDAALNAGFVQVDEFILAGRPGPQPQRNPNGTVRRQVHAAHVHSFFCVFQMPSRRR